MAMLNTPGHIKARFGAMRFGSLREAPSGARTLCLATVSGADDLGDVIATDPWLEDALAPLVARFAALVFAPQPAHLESFLQELHWLTLEHGIDHVVLPLWPESALAHDLFQRAKAQGLPHDFLLTQDQAEWPHQTAVYQLRQSA